MNTQEIITHLKAQGFKVYGPEQLSSYVYFTDGTCIGYAQQDSMRGTRYATVHMPNKTSGTGFEARDPKAALGFAPQWVFQRDLNSVVKYRDFEHFRSKHWQPLVQY